MVNVHCIWSSMHLTACFLLLCAPLSVPLGQWWVYNDFDQSLSSEFLWIGEVNMFSLRVSSFSLLSLSLSSCRFGVPSLRPSVCFQFTVYSNAAGCSEPLGMKSRLVSDSQLSASSSYRTWGIDTFTWHPQFARLDKQGKTNAWSPAHNNRSEWIQVSETSKCH